MIIINKKLSISALPVLALIFLTSLKSRFRSANKIKKKAKGKEKHVVVAVSNPDCYRSIRDCWDSHTLANGSPRRPSAWPHTWFLSNPNGTICIIFGIIGLVVNTLVVLIRFYTKTVLTHSMGWHDCTYMYPIYILYIHSFPKAPR